MTKKEKGILEEELIARISFPQDQGFQIVEIQGFGNFDNLVQNVLNALG